ncbi:MAG: aminotransferase class V-fold PLP-dependent enzyme [Hyalangium sp.]|uniref:aminotransferase class V-fold PLP-dependent enzyme n=1 Tax=Hyalangium sp. TaxID=2028555 RepID=UPI00389A3C41
MPNSPQSSETPVPVRPDGTLDGERVRHDFPLLLRRRENGQPLYYLDNAATTHKPRVVIESLQELYSTLNAKNREEHALSQAITQALKEARQKVATFLHAEDPSEIIFVRNATEAINLVAYGFGRSVLQPGDEVVLTHLEHHSNIVPWLMACEQTGAQVRVAPVTEAGEVEVEKLEALLSERTRLVAVSHVSNVFGTILPLRRIIRAAHARGIPVLIDGAQGAPHLPVDVLELGCDFYACSSHKLYGPMGVGVLYGRTDWLERLPAYQGGSEMAEEVSFEKWKPKPLPKKFEAGSPALMDAIGLGRALDYVQRLGMDRIALYEKELLGYARQQLGAIDRVKLVGNPRDAVGVLSFTVEGAEPKKVSEFLDQEAGVAVRAGRLAAQPIMDFLKLKGAIRMSVALYTAREEIDALVQGLRDFLKQH